MKLCPKCGANVLVLAECITNGLLEIESDVKCKNKLWYVLYLNRTLCVHFKLPLQKGGWREQSIDELMKWI